MNRWTNWAKNQSCAPARIARPVSEDEVTAAVREAVTHGAGVRVAGSGHSFTAVVPTDGWLLDFSGYGEVVWCEPATRRVCVQAGMPLTRLNGVLAERGLALPNLGDIAYQTVSGATQTATHGTGARWRNLSSAVVGLRLLDGRGDAIDCDAEHNADVLDVARVGIGALGVVSTVTLQCVDAFNLHAREGAELVDDVLDRLDDEVDANDHFEFFWVPNTRWCLTKRNRRTQEPIRRRPLWRELRDDWLLDDLGFGAVLAVGRWRNGWLPLAAKRLPSKGSADYIDASPRVFASPRHVPFVEMEYAIPRGAVRDAMRELRALVDRLGWYVGFPVEVRFTAPDDIPLSTAFGRDTAYIAVHAQRQMPWEGYFRGVESIMDGFDGRPHWGKLHFQTAETLAPRYPRWGEFQAMRARLDPAGTFSNDHIRKVLGPVVR